MAEDTQDGDTAVGHRHSLLDRSDATGHHLCDFAVWPNERRSFLRDIRMALLFALLHLPVESVRVRADNEGMPWVSATSSACQSYWTDEPCSD